MNIPAGKVSDAWLKDIKERNIERMTNLAEKRLNPKRYALSKEAKKRLRWLNVLYYEQDGNVTKAANKVGISRQWLSPLKTLFEKKGKDPRVLEPESKAPHSTRNRKRISKDTEDKILKIRKDSRNVWGKVKIAVALERDYRIKINPNTVNNYLRKHKMIDPKISLKNSRAWQAKKARENPETELFVRYRPPKAIKDLAPGALVEKDMKYIEKQTRMTTGKESENFYSQHTEIDSFTRIRSLELAKDSTAKGSREAHEKTREKFGFAIACENTDNGGENKKEFREALKKETVFQFYSNAGTPTDNPRVERSHLTDEIEFYRRGGFKKTFEEQAEAIKEWEHFYNWTRPHQALGYLTPVAFYELWKTDKEKAFAIVKKYQMYLAKQRVRLASARRIKKTEQVQKLMEFIDVKLNKKVGIIKAKNNLINCQLCSVA
ncbi:MAG: integrase core domain-containing protein [bacterium]|nr:integrase core domain-containing protein [bacterium]